MRKRRRVMERKMMMRVEAPLLRPPVTLFTSAAMVGMGRGVGVVGGGTMQLLLSAFITVPIWHSHSITWTEDRGAVMRCPDVMAP